MTDSSNAIKVEEVDPHASDAWDREVLSHPAASVFHESSWARVLSESYGHAPCYLRFSRAREIELPYLRATPPFVDWTMKHEGAPSLLTTGFRFLPLPIDRRAGRT